MSVRYVNSNWKEWLSQVPDTPKSNYLYITDWQVDGDDYFGVGINKMTRKLEKFKVANLSSGLYVWALNQQTLKELLVNFTISDITYVKQNTEYMNNHVTVLDDIMKSGRYQPKWKLFKLHTTSFNESKSLHYSISNSTGFLQHIAVLGQWNLSTFMMMEFHVKGMDYIYGKYINERLQYLENIESNFNLFTTVYDIETVSNYDHRIPTGNFFADHIMSVTFIKGTEIITLFNIPLTFDHQLDAAKSIIDKISAKDYYKMETRTTLVYNTEWDLLAKLFELFESIDEAYICLGYNSRNYDMPFLLTRAIYLGMPQVSKFYYVNGILSYGMNMIHVDLNQVLVKYFAQELSSFSLKNVAKALLEDDDTQKVDFNARNLRYIYQFMIESGHLNNGKYDNVLCRQPNPWSISLDIMAKYNEMDCLVVLALWDKLQYEHFITYASRVFFLPLVRLGLSKLNEYLSTNMIYEGLQQNTIFAHHTNSSLTMNSQMMYTLNIENISSDANKAFHGGFNERKNRGCYHEVHAMDARAYYPELISGMNLSHETASLLRIKDLKLIARGCTNFDESFKIMKFCTHKAINQNIKPPSTTCENIINAIASAAYVHCMVDNCPTIKFEDLDKYNDMDKVVVLHKTHRGILSKIIEQRNTLRNIAKSSKKEISSHIDACQTLLSEYKLKNRMGSNKYNDDEEEEISYSDDDDNNDDNEEEISYDDYDDDDEDDMIINKVYSIEDFKIPKDKHTEEAVYMVTKHIRLLEKKDFNKFEDAIKSLELYIEDLKLEFTRLNSHYRNMKLLNNSIYGLLGASYGTIKAKNLAAIVTMLGRHFIVEASRIGNMINANMIYSDTDSVFFSISNAIVKNSANRIISGVNRLNANVVLNDKVYKDMFVLGKKTYIATCNDMIFSRGINKNGPNLWKTMMDRFYVQFIKNRESLNFSGVYDILFDMYMDTYKLLYDNRNAILRLVSIRTRESYKMNTVVTKLIDRISLEKPDYKFDSKVYCFYRIFGDISNTHLALDIEMDDTPIEEINLYKFYSNIVSTYYLIFAYAIEQTNQEKLGYVIKYPMQEFNKANKYSFIKALASIKEMSTRDNDKQLT